MNARARQLLFGWAQREQERKADDERYNAFVRSLRGGFDAANDIRLLTAHCDREEILGTPPHPSCREYT